MNTRRAVTATGLKTRLRCVGGSPRRYHGPRQCAAALMSHSLIGGSNTDGSRASAFDAPGSGFMALPGSWS